MARAKNRDDLVHEAFGRELRQPYDSFGLDEREREEAARSAPARVPEIPAE